MLIVPEREIANLMTRKAAFDAVEQVFAAMASGDGPLVALGVPGCTSTQDKSKAQTACGAVP